MVRNIATWSKCSKTQNYKYPTCEKQCLIQLSAVFEYMAGKLESDDVISTVV